jgi:hypothetical protein
MKAFPCLLNNINESGTRNMTHVRLRVVSDIEKL